MISENALTPMFLASLSVMELVALQHDLRSFPEDRANLDAVLAEIKRRDTAKPLVVLYGEAIASALALECDRLLMNGHAFPVGNFALYQCATCGYEYSPYAEANDPLASLPPCRGTTTDVTPPAPR